MPFSRHPTTRNLHRVISDKDNEIAVLQAQLRRLQQERAEVYEEPSTPQKDAIAILQKVAVTPSAQRIHELLPCTETMSRVRKASIAVKTTLFSGKTAKRTKGIAKVLDSKIRMSRDYIFNVHKSRSFLRLPFISFTQNFRHGTFGMYVDTYNMC